jgi:hypothetical protein
MGYGKKTPPPLRAMGFSKFLSTKLNHARRAAGRQRKKQQAQVQISVHAATHTPQARKSQILFYRDFPLPAPIHERFLREGRLQRTNRMAAAR